MKNKKMSIMMLFLKLQVRISGLVKCGLCTINLDPQRLLLKRLSKMKYGTTLIMVNVQGLHLDALEKKKFRKRSRIL